MALTLDVPTDRAISLEEYLHLISTTVDFADEESLCASATHLRALANDRRFLADVLNRELARWQHFQSENFYTIQALLLGQGPQFILRANVWIPPERIREDPERLNRIFSYLTPHDHPYTFLTVGYWGSGYRTTIWAYDRAKVQGIPGEPVELRLVEKTSLPTFKVMLYRAAEDVHAQAHPEELSISLNLVAMPAEVRSCGGLTFDVEQGRVVSFSSDMMRTTLPLCAMAGVMGNARTASLLEALAQRSRIPHIRGGAWRALLTLEPQQRETIAKHAADDPSPVVRAVGIRALEAD